MNELTRQRLPRLGVVILAMTAMLLSIGLVLPLDGRVPVPPARSSGSGAGPGGRRAPPVMARRWLGLPVARIAPLLPLLAPLLGYASLYWVLRPWMNLSSVLACLCWAFFFWTLWREDARLPWLLATTFSVGAAAAVRPDYAGFLLLSATLLILANHPGQWRLVALCIFGAGLAAVIPNLIMNRATTGHAFRAAYQIVLDRQYGADPSHGLDGSNGLSLFSVLKVLLAPMGLPSVKVGTKGLYHEIFRTGGRRGSWLRG